MKPYPVQLEICGPTALWTWPDTGSSPVSYIAPTFSVAKGIFESILRWKSVNVRPTRCEICAPDQVAPLLDAPKPNLTLKPEHETSQRSCA